MVLEVLRFKMSKRFPMTHSGVLALLAKGWLCGLKRKLKRNLLRFHKYAEISFTLGQEVPDLKMVESRRADEGSYLYIFYSCSFSSHPSNLGQPQSMYSVRG